MTKIHCRIYHETDGACCDDTHPEDCLLQEIRIPPAVRANANLSLAHLALFSIVVSVIYGWGLYTLDRAIARDTPSVIATSR